MFIFLFFVRAYADVKSTFSLLSDFEASNKDVQKVLSQNFLQISHFCDSLANFTVDSETPIPEDLSGLEGELQNIQAEIDYNNDKLSGLYSQRCEETTMFVQGLKDCYEAKGIIGLLKYDISHSSGSGFMEITGKIKNLINSQDTPTDDMWKTVKLLEKEVLSRQENLETAEVQAARHFAQWKIDITKNIEMLSQKLEAASQQLLMHKVKQSEVLKAGEKENEKMEKIHELKAAAAQYCQKYKDTVDRARIQTGEQLSQIQDTIDSMKNISEIQEIAKADGRHF